MNNTIIVYGFQKYDIERDEMIRSKRMATQERIRELGCEVIEGTGIQIPSTLLDENGLYHPPQSA
jgi:hypothetical protein